MPKRCCVKGCTSKGQTMHRFPNPKKELDLFYQWVDILGIESGTPLQIYENKRICFAHFDPSNKSPGHKILHRYAIPTIGIPAVPDQASSSPGTETAAADLNDTVTEN